MAHYGLSHELEPGEIVRDLPPGGLPGHMVGNLWPMMAGAGPGGPHVHMPPGLIPPGMGPPRPGLMPPHLGGMYAPPMPPPPGLGLGPHAASLMAMQQASMMAQQDSAFNLHHLREQHHARHMQDAHHHHLMHESQQRGAKNKSLRNTPQHSPHTPTMGASHTPMSSAHTPGSAGHMPGPFGNSSGSLSHTIGSMGHTPGSLGCSPGLLVNTPGSAGHTPGSLGHTPGSTQIPVSTANTSMSPLHPTNNTTSPQSTTTSPQSQKSPSKVDDESRIDIASAKGIFGWTTVDKVNFPYLIRDKKSFLSVRMVEQKLLSKYPSVYPEELKNRPPLMSHYITDHEARLLNEINMEHCAFEYGQEPFRSQKDLIVSVADFEDFYAIVKKHFPDNTSTGILHNATTINPTKAIVDGGWLQINNTVIPYVLRTNVKMLPLSVIRYAAGLLTNTDVQSISPTQEECEYLNITCTKAGLKFNFETSSKLLAEPLLFTYSNPKPKVLELPKDDPFGYAQYEDSPEKDVPNGSESVPLGASLPNVPFSSPNVSRAPPANIFASWQPSTGYRSPLQGPMTGPPLMFPHWQPALGYRGPTPHPLGNPTGSTQPHHASAHESIQALRDLTKSYHKSSGVRGGPPPLVPINKTKGRRPSAGSKSAEGPVTPVATSPIQPQALPSVPPLVITPAEDPVPAGPQVPTPQPHVHTPGSTPPGAPSNATAISKDLAPPVSGTAIAATTSGSQGTALTSTVSPRPAIAPLVTSATSAATVVTMTTSPSKSLSTTPRRPQLSPRDPETNENKIRPVEYQSKTISCLVKGGENFALVEALSRVYFAHCSLEEFTFALEKVLCVELSDLSPREEQSFIAFYGLPTQNLKCNKIVLLDTFDQYMPQLKYMFENKQKKRSKESPPKNGQKRPSGKGIEAGQDSNNNPSTENGNGQSCSPGGKRHKVEGTSENTDSKLKTQEPASKTKSTATTDIPTSTEGIVICID